MRLRSLATLAAACTLATPSAAIAQPSTLEQARQARFAGRLDEAERLLSLALRDEPNNYMALYNMGLLHEMRAVRIPSGEPRLRHYRLAAQWLEKAYRSPGRATAGADAYTIYNSLGAMYLGLGDLTRAGPYLREGLKNQGRLSGFSKGRLYANFGYYNALQGDIPQARRYFELGSRYGSPFARESLRRLDAANLR